MEEQRGDTSPEKPVVNVFAAAEHFDQETFDKASAALGQYFTVGGGLIYQFSELPPAKVIVEVTLATLQQLVPSIAASALWDGIKWLLKPKHSKETILFLDVVVGRRKLSSHIVTTDREVIQDALRTWRDAALSFDISSFDEDQLLHAEYDVPACEWRRVPPATSGHRKAKSGGRGGSPSARVRRARKTSHPVQR